MNKFNLNIDLNDESKEYLLQAIANKGITQEQAENLHLYNKLLDFPQVWEHFLVNGSSQYATIRKQTFQVEDRYYRIVLMSGNSTQHYHKLNIINEVEKTTIDYKHYFTNINHK